MKATISDEQWDQLLESGRSDPTVSFSRIIEFGFLPRDWSQTAAANHISMIHFEEIVGILQQINDSGPAVLGRVELTGGQQPATEHIVSQNPFKVLDRLAQRISETTKGSNTLSIAMLARGSYVVGLLPRTAREAKTLLDAFITRSTGGDRSVPFYLKVFDSQLNVQELAATLEAAANIASAGQELRLELSLPYEVDFLEDNFSEEFYVARLNEHLQALSLEMLNRPNVEVLIGLKDMIGHLDEPSVKSLLPKMVSAISDFEKQRGLSDGSIGIAVHSHDTGFAAEANRAVVETALVLQQMTGVDRKFILDVVADLEIQDEKERTFAGFTESAGLVVDSLTTQQKSLIKRLNKSWNNLARVQLPKALELASLNHPSDFPLTNQSLRAFSIPGGGRSHLVKAVNKSATCQSLITRHGFTEKQAVNLLGGLIFGVAQEFAHVTSVTPGFTFKYELALEWLSHISQEPQGIESLRKAANACIEIGESEIPLSESLRRFRDEHLFELGLHDIDSFDARFGKLFERSPEKATFFRGRMPGGYLSEEKLEILANYDGSANDAVETSGPTKKQKAKTVVTEVAASAGDVVDVVAKKIGAAKPDIGAIVPERLGDALESIRMAGGLVTSSLSRFARTEPLGDLAVDQLDSNRVILNRKLWAFDSEFSAVQLADRAELLLMTLFVSHGVDGVLYRNLKTWVGAAILMLPEEDQQAIKNMDGGAINTRLMKIAATGAFSAPGSRADLGEALGR